uniref:Putative ovule protein n=1 Tax=Solanum chacoense TaxID=4108 RepID=A0A0V0GG21_SOLCH
MTPVLALQVQKPPAFSKIVNNETETIPHQIQSNPNQNSIVQQYMYIIHIQNRTYHQYVYIYEKDEFIYKKKI